ncbi:MAG TPA: hypothetical protein VE778_04405 [Candidatus Bathyarchaeia archaeon]|nr:hypothetical protein [Candidatus Bathyarchaeia archaeon]
MLRIMFFDGKPWYYMPNLRSRVLASGGNRISKQAVGVYAQDKPTPVKEQKLVEKEENGPQVVLTVLKNSDGKTYVMATKKAVIFSLIPLSGETARALQQGASMVCRMRTASTARKDGTDQRSSFLLRL